MTAFMMAAVLAGGITFIVYRRLSAATQQRRGIPIVVAASDLATGTTLSAKNTLLVDWYSEALPSGAFTKIDDVVGHPLLYPLAAKEPVLQRDLGVEGAGIGLAGKIPEGMRAIAVRSNEIVGVAGFLYPGSHVDVLVTLAQAGGLGMAAAQSATSPVTRTVLQNVEVLTAGQTIEPDPQGKPQTVSVVTLLVSPEESQKLQLASAQGAIQFVLRSGADQQKVELSATRLDQLFPQDSHPAPATKPAVRSKRVVPPAASAYSLELIQGTKRSVEKFDDE